MSNAKHTKGPWGDTGRDRNDHKMIPLRSIYCERLGYSIGFVSSDRHGEPEANARLIAAAPELLEALQRIEKRIAYYASLADGEAPNIEQWSYTDQSGDVAFARAAIAKATGEQPK